ncbi:hypothetical protein JTB14_026592 [Gonioctena quinquepunctata]|nr:hypothetical protein JTB14_026592 [Gonioctena quinquepunctata]
MLSAVDNTIIELIEVPNMRLINNVEHSYKSPTSDNLSTEPSSHAERVITLLNEQNSMFGPSHISAISSHYASDETAEDTGGTSAHDESSEVITQHGPLPLMPIFFNTPQNAGTDLISDESDVNMGLVPYSDHSDSDMSLDYPKKVTELRAIKYYADVQVDYKFQFCDDWDLLPQRRANGVDACTFDELDQLHSRRYWDSSESRTDNDLEDKKILLGSLKEARAKHKVIKGRTLIIEEDAYTVEDIKNFDKGNDCPASPNNERKLQSEPSTPSPKEVDFEEDPAIQPTKDSEQEKATILKK